MKAKTIRSESWDLAGRARDHYSEKLNQITKGLVCYANGLDFIWEVIGSGLRRAKIRFAF